MQSWWKCFFYIIYIFISYDTDRQLFLQKIINAVIWYLFITRRFISYLFSQPSSTDNAFSWPNPGSKTILVMYGDDEGEEDDVVYAKLIMNVSN